MLQHLQSKTNFTHEEYKTEAVFSLKRSPPKIRRLNLLLFVLVNAIWSFANFPMVANANASVHVIEIENINPTSLRGVPFGGNFTHMQTSAAAVGYWVLGINIATLPVYLPTNLDGRLRSCNEVCSASGLTCENARWPKSQSDMQRIIELFFPGKSTNANAIAYGSSVSGSLGTDYQTVLCVRNSPAVPAATWGANQGCQYHPVYSSCYNICPCVTSTVTTAPTKLPTKMPINPPTPTKIPTKLPTAKPQASSTLTTCGTTTSKCSSYGGCTVSFGAGSCYCCANNKGPSVSSYNGAVTCTCPAGSGIP